MQPALHQKPGSESSSPADKVDDQVLDPNWARARAVDHSGGYLQDQPMSALSISAPPETPPPAGERRQGARKTAHDPAPARWPAGRGAADAPTPGHRPGGFADRSRPRSTGRAP